MPLGTSAPGHGKTRPTTTKPRQHKKKPTTTTTAHLHSAAPHDPTTTSPLYTISKRFMGVRVSAKDKERQRKKQKQQVEKEERRETQQFAFKSEEVKSILPQRNVIDDATIQAQRLKTKPAPIGLSKAIFTTETVPTLSFNASADQDNDDDVILTNQDYIKKRKQDEEKLVWEHEVKKMKSIEQQLEKRKGQDIKDLAQIPGFELSAAQQERLEAKVVADIEKKQQKKKKSRGLYENELGDDDNDDDGSGDDINPNIKKPHKQDSSDHLVERLTLAQQRIVNKIKSRAYQQGSTPYLYCKQNQLPHLIPLLGLRPFKEAREERERAAAAAAAMGGGGDQKKKQKRKYEDNEDGESGEFSSEDIDEHELFSDHDTSPAGRDEYNNIDIDDVFQDLGDFNDEIGEFAIPTSNNNNNNNNKLQTTNNTKTTKNGALPSIIMRGVQPQNDADKDHRYELDTFDNLKPKPALGVRLNPKIFSRKTKNIDFPGDNNNNNNNTTIGDKNNDDVDPSKIYVHRRRPAIPDSSFLELGINPGILSKLALKHIREPTAVQKMAIPFFSRKYNPRTKKIYTPPTVALQAFTGSGKTLAYAAPMLTNIDPNIANKIPPPNVIAATRQLLGIKSLPQPPPLEADPTPVDEVERKVRLIQYSNDTMFNADGSNVMRAEDINDKHAFFQDVFDQEDIAENDVETLFNTRQFIDRLTNEVDIFNMTPAQWEAYVFEQEVIERETRAKLQEKLQQQEEEQEEKQAPQQNKNKNKNNKYNNNKTPLPARIDATIFNSRVYSLEAVRLRKKQAIQQKLKEIFPFIDPKLLDPDLPQSTLQSIIIVPTKELALQVSKELIEMNHTTYQSSKAIQGSHQFYGDKNIHVVPHKGKNPINIRMATGKVDPILLSSLGVFLHKNLDAVKQEQQELQNGGKVDENGNPITTPTGGHHQKTPTQLMRNQYNVKRGMDMASGKTMVQQDKYLDEQFTPEKARDHPFVEFGKGHKHFRPDQKEYRKELQEREKEQMMRVMRLRERQLQGEKLSTFEESEILIFDDKQQRKQHNKTLQSKSSAVNGDNDNDDDETYEDDYDEAVEVYSNNNNNNNNNDNDESDDFIEFIDEKDYDYEDNPEKLLKLSNRDLLKQYDNFRGDYFDPAHNKHIRKLSVEQRRELKTRLAVALTEQNETDYITQQTRAEKNRQDELMRMGLPVVRMQKRGGEGGDDEMEKLKKRRKEEIKQRYMQEVSDTLLEQIGGQHGDFVEVVRERQPHVIVGTPSTITQLIKSGALQLPSTGPSPAQLKYMVFDEMDHLARNESSPEHHALLELLSLPTDQTAFVSASMTRDSARLLTRLARRQDQFINNTNPQRETVCNLLNFPRPPAQAIPEEVQEQAYNDAFAYAQEKVEHFQTEVASNDLALSEMVLGSTRAKKERIKALSDKLNDPEEKQGVIQKITDSLYKQNFAPTIPDDVFKANLQKSIDRGRLGLTSTSDEYGEVLFLSTEDYRVEKQQDGGNNNKVDEHALPIPPFVKQYYLAPPEISPELLKQEEAKQGKKFNRLRYVQRVKDKLALDLICQFKLRPLTLKKNDRNAQKMELTEIAQKQQDMFFNNIDHTKAANHFNKHDAMGNDIEDDINMFSQHLAEEKKQQQQQYKSNAKKKMKLQTNITASEICPGTVLVFFNPRREEDMMDYYKQLSDTGLKVGIYCHASNRHQKYEVLTKNSKLDVILANDTLSRGLDFKSVSMVLNIDTPRSTSTYIHRSGRVGRVGGMYRKSAIVVNIADVQPQVLEKPEQEQEQQENNDKNKTTTTNDDTPPQIILPKGSETLTLLKHAEKTGVTVHSWPYVVPYNLNRVYLRSLKSIISQQAEEQGVARHLHRKAATEEYVKARNVKLHKMGIIQTRKSGLLSDLPEGYGDSAFQAKGGLGAGKKMQGIAINKLQNKVGQALRGGNSQPWIKTGGGDKSGKGGKTRTIKH